MRRFADVSWVNVLGVAAALCALAACGSKASCPKGTVDQGGRCVETNSDASAEDADTGGDGGDACVGAACQPVCAAEVCNGKDDDCDTFVDEGVQTFGPTQEMPNMAAFLVGIAPWAQEKTIAFVLPTNASPASLQLVELSKDGVPAGAGRTVFNSLSASFVGDVVGDVVLAFAQPLNGDPMRLLTYDLIAKKTIKGRTLEGKLLSYSVVDEGGEQLLRVASRVATNNPKVTTYSFPELVFKAERSFSTNPGDTLPQLLTGAGDETLYTVIEDTLLGLTDGGAVLSYTLPGANLVFGAQIAVTPDRVAVLHADQASGNGARGLQRVLEGA
jgi:hypothetical protein